MKVESYSNRHFILDALYSVDLHSTQSKNANIRSSSLKCQNIMLKESISLNIRSNTEGLNMASPQYLYFEH
jgi:hypothetical protein